MAGATNSPAAATTATRTYTFGDTPAATEETPRAVPSTVSRDRLGMRHETAPYARPPTALPAESAASTQATEAP